MGRKVVEATNAWRMRRMRGEIGRLRLFAAAKREAAALFCDEVLAVGFFGAGFAVPGLFAGVLLGAAWPVLVCPAGCGCGATAGDAGAGAVSLEGVADCGAADAAKLVLARKAPTSARMRHELEGNPGNGRFFRRDARARSLSKDDTALQRPRE